MRPTPAVLRRCRLLLAPTPSAPTLLSRCPAIAPTPIPPSLLISLGLCSMRSRRMTPRRMRLLTRSQLILCLFDLAVGLDPEVLEESLAAAFDASSALVINR